MTWREFDEGENKAVPGDYQVDPRFEIRSGDLLFSRANTVTHVGAIVQVRDTRPRLLLSDKSLRLVPHRGVSPRWLLHYVRSRRARNYLESLATGTSDSMRNISQSSLRSLPVPLAPLPEQERVVDAIEDAFLRIDAGAAGLRRAQRDVVALKKAVILAAVPEPYPAHWQVTTVGQAGEVTLGRQRSPKYHHGPNMRQYLRVANVFEDRIDTADIMSMHFDDAEYQRYRLYPDDILLNEGQSPHLLGRPAMYRGDPPDVAFTNSLLRFRVGPVVMPGWALLVFRRHLHAKRFLRESQITTNIAHLSAGRFKTVEFPIPPMDEQETIVANVEAKLAAAARTASELEVQEAYSGRLRSSILSAAFAGELVPQEPNDEPASVLLERIAAEPPSSNGHDAEGSRKTRTHRQKVTT
jgi:type I restriction enzyme S subunit